MGVKVRYCHGTSIHLMLVFALQIFAACYYPDGNLTEDHPCDPSASTSSCCGAGWDCQPNGLCKDRASESWARGTCTDKDWASSACPQICRLSAINSGLGRCRNNNWCCKASVPEGEDCCTIPDSLFYFAQAEPPPVSSPQESLQTTIAPVTASTVSTSTSISLVYYTSSLPMPTQSIYTATTSRTSTRSFTSSTKSANSTAPTGNSTSASPPPESRPATTSETPPLANTAPDKNPPPAATSPTDKLIAGIGVPLGCLLLVFTAFYLLHRRRKHKSEQQHHRLQHEEKLRNWYTPVIRREPHELDTRLIMRPYNKPELSEDARRHVVEVSADDRQGVRSMRASVVQEPGGGRKSSSTILEWIRNQPRTWI